MKAGELLLNLLFPPKCPFCMAVMERPGSFCLVCQGELPWTQGTQGDTKGEFFSRCVSPLHFRDRVREGVHRFKFEGRRYYGGPFGILMAQCVQDRMSVPLEVVTWAPVSWRRRRRRGFDQGEVLARSVGRALNLPVERLLEKIRDTPAQSRLQGADQRRANVLGAYRLAAGARPAGRTVLLVDDVVTSNSTLSECARVLREGGTADIFCVTLAKAGGKHGENGG